MRGVIALARACHPGPTVAVTAIAVLLGLSVDLAGPLVVLVGVTVLVGQLSIGWSNDWLDAARDAAAGRAEKPTTTGEVTPAAVRTAALLSAAGSVPLSFAAGSGGGWNLVLVASGWAYNLGLKGTRWSPVPYATGFGALPLYVLGTAGVGVPWWLPFCGALLGVAAHFANAAPDISADRALGVLGMPQRIGARASLTVALALLGFAGVILLTSSGLSGVALFAGAVLVAAPLIVGAMSLIRGADGRLVFVVVMVAAVVDVALLIGAP